MSEHYNRSPMFSNVQLSNTGDNVSRQSRREQSLEKSRLPTYRRSKSAVSLSGCVLKGKKSITGRSSSANKNPQHLFAGSSQKLLSQRPGSLANKFLTPLNRQQSPGFSGFTNRLTTGNKLSPWLKHSGNKEAQKKEMAKEFNRIRQVLAYINCDIQLTKPVPLRDFVSILIHLFNTMKLDSQLTFSNYITVVPIIMKNLNYTGTCSASMLKTVNTMHSWTHVLGLLSYLCDAIDAQFGSDPGINGTNPIANIFRKTACKLVMPANTSKTQELYSEYKNEVLKIYGVDLQKLKNKKDKQFELLNGIDLEEKRLCKLQSDYDTRKAQEEDIDIKLCKIKYQSEHNEGDCANQLVTMSGEIKELDLQIVEAFDKKHLMKELFKKQLFSKNDVSQLLQEINDLDETCRLQGERNEKLEIEWNNISLEQSKVQGKLKAIAIEFNANLNTMSTNRNELQDILVPESGFSRYSKEDFETIISNCRTVFSTVHERISELKRKIIESEKECDKNAFALDNLKSDISRIKSKKNHKLELRKREKQDFDHKLEELEKELQNKRDIILSLLDEKESLQMDLKEYTEISLKLDGKIIEIENIFKQNRKNADEAISQSLFDIAKFMQTYTKEYKSYVEEKIKYQNKMDDLKKSFRRD